MRNPFSRLFHKRDSDFGDIRSHVLNERFREPFDELPPAPAPPPAPPRYEGYDDFTQKTRDVFAPYPVQQPPPPPPGFEPLAREPALEKVSRDYDIMDRLNIIESQLSAIRSQTELINERLKNMESRLVQRRY